MSDFPHELVLALIFGMVLLVQFVSKKLRRTAQLIQAQNAPPAEARPAAPPPASMRIPARAEPGQAQRIKALRDASSDSAVPASVHLWRPAGRFSRPSLMPDRHAVQNAVVIATILGPCHAQQPPEVDRT
jgi:hypothetical protein